MSFARLIEGMSCNEATSIFSQSESQCYSSTRSCYCLQKECSGVWKFERLQKWIHIRPDAEGEVAKNLKENTSIQNETTATHDVKLMANEAIREAYESPLLLVLKLSTSWKFQKLEKQKCTVGSNFAIIIW